MFSYRSKTVLVTGASSGIGAALALELGRRGANVVLFARREDRLRELASQITAAGGKALACVGDVTREADLSEMVRRAETEFGGLDVVIANAGFGVVGRFEALNDQDYERQFQTNVWGVLRTLRSTLEPLKKSSGRIAVVGSVTGYVSLPGNTAYAMSKFAVRALCDGLRLELQPYRVSLTHIAPGFVESEIRRVNNQGKLLRGSKDQMPSWLQMRAEVAARKILRAVAWRRRERMLTAHAHLIIWLERFTPWLVFGLFKIFRVSARSEAR